MPSQKVNIYLNIHKFQVWEISQLNGNLTLEVVPTKVKMFKAFQFK